MVVYSGYQWFVLTVQGSYEKKAALILEVMGRARQLPDFELVNRIWVPKMMVSEPAADGSIKEKLVSTLPGYLLVEALLTRELFASLNQPDLPYIYGWLKIVDDWPSRISESEVQELVALQKQAPENVELQFQIGDSVSIPSLKMKGEVVDITDTVVVVEVEIFNRKVETRISLENATEMTRLV